MVLPEGASSPESGRRAGWKLGGAVALVAIAVGAAIALLAATTPSPEAASSEIAVTSPTEPLQAPTTSTTTVDVANFTVAAIATGERLSWFRAPTFVSGWPIAVVSHDGQLWLFTATITRGAYRDGAGLTAWVSSDGIDWQPAGLVASEEFSITGVEGVGDRFVAMGNRVLDGTPHVWISRDGSEWTVFPLPIDLLEEASGYRSWLTGLAGVGNGLYLTGFVETDWEREIVDRLPPEVAEYVIYEYGLGYGDLGDGEKRIEVYGPLGLLGYTATLSELGIDPETAARVFDGSPIDTSFLWRSDDGNNWSQLRLEDMWVQELAALPDGTLFLNGGDYRGDGIWTSRTGSEWERLPSRTHVRVVGSWNGNLLGISNERDLVLSSNGDDWESLGTGELLPGRLYWQLDPIAAGEACLAVLATTWPENFSRQPVTVTIRDDGSALTFDPVLGTVTVSNGELEATLPLWTGDATGLADVDFAAEAVSFLHPESGESIGRFTFDALHRAEMTAFGPDPGERALLLTGSGEEWSIIDLAEEIGPETRVLMMECFGDQLVMVTTTSSLRSTQESVRFSVRVANLP